MSSWSREALFKSLQGLQDAYLEIVTPDGSTHRFGDHQSDLHAKIVIHTERFFSRVVWGGDDGAGDSYVDGDWDSPDLVAVIRLAVRNIRHLEQGGMIRTLASRLINRLAHLRNDNSLEGSRRNISAHYDLSNDFFQLFLDRNMVYSSAIYPHANATLEEAQVEKLDRICRNLKLTHRDRVLEIGTGWGALTLHAVRNYGCQVTTTTISKEQHAYAAARFSEAGVQDRVTLLLEDYRKLAGTFDKIISIEMFEAVGFAHYDDFFGTCDRLLTPEGTMALQTITMNEQHFDAYRKRSDWIQRRVFPGAELSSVREIQSSLARCTDLGTYHLEDIGMHYAYTLAEWRARFHYALPQVRALGFDPPFIRTWDYYLAFCEGGFRERYISDVQVLFTKNGNRRALLGEGWQIEDVAPMANAQSAAAS